MMKAPEDVPYGMSYSVEFCGGTHVMKSKEIFRITILSEEPVAKGIRRITCCSGAQAASLTALRAKELSLELDEIRSIPASALLDVKISQLRQRLNESSEIGLLTKRKMLVDADALKEKAIKAGKGDAKKLLAVAKEAAESVMVSEGERGLVHVNTEINADIKAAGAALEVLLYLYFIKTVLHVVVLLRT